MSADNVIKKIERAKEQAEYNFKISQNEWNPTKGLYFKGKIKAYTDIIADITKEFVKTI